MFNFLLYTALIIFLLGLIYKVSNWFTRNLSDARQNFTAGYRVASAARGLARTLFSPKLLLIFKALVVDVMLQTRVFREDVFRWLAHMLIFYGFVLLLLMHAFQSQITEALFTDYYPTVNPFFFLRDLFGVMVLIGVGMAIFRRYISRPRRLRTGPRDHYAIILLEKEKLVVSLYYSDELTMKEIGQVLNITESRVSQIHAQAIIHLRGKLRRDGLLED